MNRRNKTRIISILLIAMMIVSMSVIGLTTTTKAANINYITDLNEMLDMSFTQVRVFGGLDKKIPTDQPADIAYSRTGDRNASYISNICLGEDYLDTPSVFSFYFLDKDFSCAGAKVGMTRSEAQQKLNAGGWTTYQYDTRADIYTNSRWCLMVYNNNEIITDMTLQGWD